MRHEPFSEEPRLIDGHPEGYLDYQARTTFRDLCRVYGFEQARQIMAEIINDEADRRPN